MKRTLVERVALRMCLRAWLWKRKAFTDWDHEARRIIAMVRRHGRKEKR